MDQSKFYQVNLPDFFLFAWPLGSGQSQNRGKQIQTPHLCSYSKVPVIVLCGDFVNTH